MRWMNLIRAYWPAIAAMAFSLLAVGVISPLRHSSFGTELMASLRWVPLGGLAVALLYGAWVTFRSWQAERGHGCLCPLCMGPLGHERSGRYGDYRRCLLCGHNANERHYR